MKSALHADVDARLLRFRTAAIGVALAGTLASLAGAFLDPSVFFRSWLMAWLIWLAPALGSLGLLMLQFLTGGQWGVVSRRIFEAGSRTLPLLAILFLPIVFGMSYLYPWTHPEIVVGDPVLMHKKAYLNIPFFVVRAGIYFVIWTALSFALSSAGERQDTAVSQSRTRRFSAIGLILYVFTMTFAATDWAQSLDPHWYSTIWGFLFVVGQALSGLSLTICALLLMAPWPPLAGVLQPRHMHDLGKLMFAFVMLWAYLSFSQLLIIWSGNLPEEIPWYVERLGTNWAGVGVALLLLHFVFPFLLLLSRPLKRHRIPLLLVAALIFCARFLEVFWIVIPESHGTGLHLHWLHFVCPVAVGGAWLAVWLTELRRRPLLPENDPRMEDVIVHA